MCDADLVGKRFEEGNLQLDLTGDFYAGEEKTETEAGDILRNADHANLVGQKSVALGIQEGIIDEAHVQHVKGIPHTQASIVHG
ncbi:DUF424 family protein [Candidatus Woesearchaeota archaeon]|nr:DUF424 family protein [Candidatus Woesearchaeota archaeon]